LAAVLFGISTPVAKVLVGSTHPVVLAGLLYCGAGVGVAVLRKLPWGFFGSRRAREAAASRADLPSVAGAILAAWPVAPVLQIGTLKGTIAGPVNLLLGVAAGGALPDLSTGLMATIVGFLCYGVSLALFVLALRHLGSARTAAYFSTAPFFGAVAAVITLHESVTYQLAAAGALM